MYICAYSQSQSESVQIPVSVDRVQFSKMEKFFQSFIYKDETDERGESLLCETGDVTDQRAGVRCYEDETKKRRPETNASAQGQVRQIIVSTEKGRENIQ